MVRIFILLLLCSSLVSTASGQDTVLPKDTIATDSLRSFWRNKTPKNEVSVNLLDFIISNRVELGYERFLGKRQSISLGTTLFDYSEFLKENHPYLNDDDEIYSGIKSYSVQLGYIRYFGKRSIPNTGFYINPTARGRFNQRETTSKIIDPNTIEIRTEGKYYWATGMGLGYKLSNKNLSCKLQLSVLKNFIPSNDPNYTIAYTTKVNAVEPRLYIGFGFRF